MVLFENTDVVKVSLTNFFLQMFSKVYKFSHSHQTK